MIDHITGMTFHNRMKKFGAEISQSIDNISSAWNAASSPSTWFAAPSIAPQPAALTATAIARENTGLFASWFRGSEITPVAQQVAPLSVKTKKVSAHAWSSLDDELEGIMANQEKRIDYVLQESTLEVANQYMSALFAHSSYFENKDFLQ